VAQASGSVGNDAEPRSGVLSRNNSLSVKSMNSGIYEKASMQTGYRAAAIDVYKSMLAVVIAEVARHEQWPYQRRKFGATDSELRRLAALLREQGVREVILSSWVGACPGREESAQVSVSNRRPKGNRAMRRSSTR